MFHQKLSALLEALSVKAVKNDVVFENDDPLCTGLQAFTQAGYVRFIHPLFDIEGMTFDNDEFNFSGQSYFGERGRSRLPPVFTLFHGDAVDAIKKIPAISLFLHGILDQAPFSLPYPYNMSIVPCQEMAGN
jgi:hypothetical protein